MRYCFQFSSHLHGLPFSILQISNISESDVKTVIYYWHTSDNNGKWMTYFVNFCCKFNNRSYKWRVWIYVIGRSKVLGEGLKGGGGVMCKSIVTCIKAWRENTEMSSVFDVLHFVFTIVFIGVARAFIIQWHAAPNGIKSAKVRSFSHFLLTIWQYGITRGLWVPLGAN